MGYKIRRSSDRKYFQHDWLKTHYTFSFGSYYDPNFMGFRDLRVINEDTIDPGKGFSPHSHRDMEIITVVLEGKIAHKDSLGSEATISAGEIQVMSAGSGIVHSEFNPDSNHHTHLYQIWILPDKTGVQPRYRQAFLPKTVNQWVLMVSKEAKGNSLPIHQDAQIFFLNLEKEKKAEYNLNQGRYGWLQVMEGDLTFQSETLHPGDGVAIDSGSLISLKANTPSKVLLFDLK